MALVSRIVKSASKPVRRYVANHPGTYKEECLE
jgi:hypothetical protein